MNKVGRYFKSCPMTGERPEKGRCATCPAGKVRGPSTGEQRIFPVDTQFCTFEDSQTSQGA